MYPLPFGCPPTGRCGWGARCRVVLAECGEDGADHGHSEDAAGLPEGGGEGRGDAGLGQVWVCPSKAANRVPLEVMAMPATKRGRRGGPAVVGGLDDRVGENGQQNEAPGLLG